MESSASLELEQTAPSKPAREPSTYCKAAFEALHLAIGGPVMPCCFYEGDIGTLPETPLEEIWKGRPLQNLRAKMLRNERDQGCRQCYELEDAGGLSLRRLMGWDASAADADVEGNLLPKSLDIRFSNRCNLKCRTCGTDYSSRWHSDAQRLGWKPKSDPLTKTFVDEKASLAALSPFLDTVEEIAFAGGEPFLQTEQYALLEELIRRKRTDVRLSYISNMTKLRFGRRDMFALWAEFDDVTLTISVDGHEKLGELIRDGMSWQQFAENVSAVRAKCPEILIKFNITISVLNIFSLQRLVEKLRKIDGAEDAVCLFNIVIDPIEYNIQILPIGLKEEVRRRLTAFGENYQGTPSQGKQDMLCRIQHVIDFMMFKDQSDKIKRLRTLTLSLDRVRSQDTAAVVPELAPLLREPLMEVAHRKIHDSRRWLLRRMSKSGKIAPASVLALWRRKPRSPIATTLESKAPSGL